MEKIGRQRNMKSPDAKSIKLLGHQRYNWVKSWSQMSGIIPLYLQVNVTES